MFSINGAFSGNALVLSSIEYFYYAESTLLDIFVALEGTCFIHKSAWGMGIDVAG